MSQIKIKEIFLRAVEIPEKDRMAFIKKECGDDEVTYSEVVSLIQHHKEDSIFEKTSGKNILKKPRKIKESDFDLTLKKIKRKQNQRLRYNIILTGVIVGMISIGIWTQQRMKTSILKVNEYSLHHNLDATVRSLDNWIINQENIVLALSKDSMIINSIEYLANKYGMGAFADKDQIWNDPIHKRLVARLNPILQILESPSFSVIDASGYRIASNTYKQLGAQINETGFQQIIPSLHKSGAKFSRPGFQKDYMEDPENVVFEVPLTWVDCSIKKGKKSLATFGVSSYADKGFNQILGVHRIGKNGHTFAFNDQGLLVSTISDIDELIAYGILKEDENAILSLKLINPENVFTKNKIDLEKYKTEELIAPVKLAISNKNESISSIHTIIDPYTTFNGITVIGAYVWLPKYNIGIVTELPAEEALEPVNYLNLILFILIALLVGFVIYFFISSRQVAKLHKEIGESSKLGQYTLIKHIGEGGMGEVYLAKHAFLSRPTAIKLLKENLIHKKDTIKRFEREVQLASRLTNPHTIQIHDFGYSEGNRFYYAMEFLEGITLADLIKIEGALPFNRVVFLLKQICYSLQETHDHGLVHRDVKPMNIMICKLGGMYDYIKVLDFGLVKDVEGEDLEMTQDAFIQGTPVYMAPERFLRPQLNDPKSDIYSIGMVAYYLITGKKVFDHIDRESLLAEILSSTPKEIAEYTSENIPEKFSTLVKGCLEKDMKDRPQNIGAILDILDQLDLEEWTQHEALKWWLDNIDKK